jgi:hypothetical protein
MECRVDVENMKNRAGEEKGVSSHKMLSSRVLCIIVVIIVRARS